MNYYFVPYHVVKDKIQSIIEANKEDFVEQFGDIEPNYEHFEMLSHLGLGYVALGVAGDVVGFAGFVVNEATTHKEKEAENVVFFFDRKNRGKHFKDLIQFAKQEFSKMGIKKITATIKSNALARLLRMNNFRKEYELWEACFE